MMFQALLATAAFAVAVIHAQLPNPRRINDYELIPFPQPTPVTIDEKAAVKFKPWLTGCMALPAVNEIGQIGTGFDVIPLCFEGQYQQVYGRSGPIDGLWAIMYAYHFLPKTESLYAWQNIVIFINDPDVPNPEIIACSLSGPDGSYTKHKPCPSENIFEGVHVGIRYRDMGVRLELFTGGATQDLILWGQMTDIARLALNATDGYANVPLNDIHFRANLEKAAETSVP